MKRALKWIGIIIWAIAAIVGSIFLFKDTPFAFVAIVLIVAFIGIAKIPNGSPNKKSKPISTEEIIMYEVMEDDRNE